MAKATLKYHKEDYDKFIATINKAKGLTEKKETSRKAMKEAKNKGLKVRGTGASISKHKAKRAAKNE